MKLVMTLLVRDEDDVIDTTIRYHLEQGVDRLIVTDNRSRDTTLDILRGYEAEGVVRIIEEARDNYAQGRWVTRMARIAAREEGADWVINGDADEFWWPHQGTLRSTFEAIPAGVGLVAAERSDFVPVPGSEAPFHRRMTVRKAVSLDAFGQPMAPKVAHRAHPRVVVSQGNHAVRRPRLVPLPGPAPIEILHFPLRTYEQFRNKIVNGGSAYRRNRLLSRKHGHGWRYLHRLHEQGALHDHYREQEHDDDALATGLASGRLVRDERLRDFLDRAAGGSGR